MRPYEFWHPRIFETPYYLYLLALCIRHRLPVKNLAKANYALDHGELGLGSKFSTQMAFAQKHFLPTIHLDPADGFHTIQQAARSFVTVSNFPVILKPDIGAVGKGILKIGCHDGLARALKQLKGPYLLQAFSPLEAEYGVFYVRRNDEPRITGINMKHFPAVVGNGIDTIDRLARAHPRYSDHWSIFLKYLDTSRVPEQDERVRLSFIGSHTMGCMFTDDTNLLTPAIERSIFSICESQPGFNFGRLDVKAESTEAFQAGEFVVIEVNGIASLPTHMFDPANTISRAYRIFLEHGKLLVNTASEHRQREMSLLSYGEIWQRAKRNHRLLNRMHAEAISALN